MTSISTPGEILEAALAKEKTAYRFYERLENQCRIDYVRDLLSRLKDEEGKHIRMIDKMLTEMKL